MFSIYSPSCAVMVWIHKIARALGVKPISMIENHHNFAWKEQLADGTEVMVHRKGATRAGKLS